MSERQPISGDRAGHVAFFLAYPHLYGGAERVVHLLASELPARGWSTEVVVPASGLLAEWLTSDGVAVTIVEAPPALSRFGGARRAASVAGAAAALPRYWRRLAVALRERATVVHTIAQRGILLAGPAARLARVPAVWNVQGIDPSRVVNAAGSLIASAMVGGSQAALTGSPWLFGRGQATVVANGLDPRIQRPAWRPAERPTVVCTARLSPEKGVDVLLRATAALLDRVPGAQVIVVGSLQRGHERHWDHLHELRRDLGLDGHVQFTGFVDRPEDVVAAAGVYAQPSHSEGFGMAALEAMACGVPVVASDVGGLAEVVGDAGVLVPPGDPDALAAALAEVLTDQALATRLGAAGLDRATSAYSLDRMLEGMIDVYQRLGGARA